MSKRTEAATRTSLSAIPDSVTCKLGDLVAALSALQRLAQRPLAQKTAYAISKLAAKMDAELKLYEKQFQALFAQYAEERAPTEKEREQGHTDATIKAVAPANVEAFQKAVKELQDVEVTLGWRPVVLAELVDPETKAALTMTVGDMMNLEPLSYGPPAE